MLLELSDITRSPSATYAVNIPVARDHASPPNAHVRAIRGPVFKDLELRWLFWRCHSFFSWCHPEASRIMKFKRALPYKTRRFLHYNGDSSAKRPRDVDMFNCYAAYSDLAVFSDWCSVQFSSVSDQWLLRCLRAVPYWEACACVPRSAMVVGWKITREYVCDLMYKYVIKEESLQ